MADKGTANISASIFMDDIKSSLGGDLSYTPVSADDDAWVFAETGIAHDADNILDTSDSYLGSSAAVSTSDKVKWLAIKNISTTATEGIGINVSAGTANYNDTGTIILGNGEMLVINVPNCNVSDLHAKSCVLDSDGKPSSQGTSTVTCQVAAILENV